MARHVLFAGSPATRRVSVILAGRDDCPNSTRTVASVAGRASGRSTCKPTGSVAFEGAGAFNSSRFPSGKLRAVGGLIKPTPAGISETGGTRTGSSAEWVAV